MSFDLAITRDSLIAIPEAHQQIIDTRLDPSRNKIVQGLWTDIAWFRATSFCRTPWGS